MSTRFHDSSRCLPGNDDLAGFPKILELHDATGHGSTVPREQHALVVLMEAIEREVRRPHEDHRIINDQHLAVLHRETLRFWLVGTNFSSPTRQAAHPYVLAATSWVDVLIAVQDWLRGLLCIQQFRERVIDVRIVKTELGALDSLFDLSQSPHDVSLNVGTREEIRHRK